MLLYINFLDHHQTHIQVDHVRAKKKEENLSGALIVISIPVLKGFFVRLCFFLSIHSLIR